MNADSLSGVERIEGSEGYIQLYFELLRPAWMMDGILTAGDADD